MLPKTLHARVHYFIWASFYSLIAVFSKLFKNKENFKRHNIAKKMKMSPPTEAYLHHPKEDNRYDEDIQDMYERHTSEFDAHDEFDAANLVG